MLSSTLEIPRPGDASGKLSAQVAHASGEELDPRNNSDGDVSPAHSTPADGASNSAF